jgi:hypothetical protein
VASPATPPASRSSTRTGRWSDAFVSESTRAEIGPSARSGDNPQLDDGDEGSDNRTTSSDLDRTGEGHGMRSGRSSHHRDFRCLRIALLILGLVPIPLPQIDFHNIRHHDGPGEVCEFHDHLLVWHPDAGLSEDVAVWHCHWLLAA